MEKSLFTEKDLKDMKARGIDPGKVSKQIEIFKKGAPFLKLVRPCTLGDGIISIPEDEHKTYANVFGQRPSILTASVFVPASGAASRMFKALLRFYNEKLPQLPFIKGASHIDPDIEALSTFLDHVDRFPFFEDIQTCAADRGVLLEEKGLRERAETILDCLFSEKGFDYANLPKGLLKFHRYPRGARTALEEHLVEASGYCTDHEGVCRLHFTVSPEHRDGFVSLFEEKKDGLEKKLGVTFRVEFSVQEPSTDTVSVDQENRPFRLGAGRLLFRPGGHGALIENLGTTRGDIIFIKNIDNIVPDGLKDETIFWKKVLGGVFLSVQERIFDYLEKMSDGPLSEELIDEIEVFTKTILGISPLAGRNTGPLKQRQERLFKALNRPLRVCGMVRNQGEPGGGPFWVESGKGTVSCQIIEKAQVDPDSEDQQRILASSTHFNPVDIVCGIKDFRGNRFDLSRFIDHRAVFISRKSKDGRELKALELPGLWNGAMAHWNTVFVETPLITFNPVKTVNDLLRDEHQVNSASRCL